MDSISQIIPQYVPRFITRQQASDLLEFWRMTSVGHKDWSASFHERMLNTCKKFVKIHPDVSLTAAYKDLCGLLDR